MKSKINLLSAAICLSMASSVALADELRDRATGMFEAIPTEAPVIEGNVLTPEKVELGAMLFFEPRLSSSHLISCNTCHNVGLVVMIICLYPLVMVGRKGHVTHRPYSMRSLTPPSSGMVVRQIWLSRLKDRFRPGLK